MLLKIIFGCKNIQIYKKELGSKRFNFYLWQKNERKKNDKGKNGVSLLYK